MTVKKTITFTSIGGLVKFFDSLYPTERVRVVFKLSEPFKRLDFETIPPARKQIGKGLSVKERTTK